MLHISSECGEVQHFIPSQYPLDNLQTINQVDLIFYELDVIFYEFYLHPGSLQCQSFKARCLFHCLF